MGNRSAKGKHTEFQGVADRVTEKASKVQFSGRYHLLPKRLEDQYVVETEEVLGTGYNGSVNLARSRANSGQKFAVKAFKLDCISGDKRKQLESEVEVFLLMDHPHIARLHDVYETETKLQMVMECMEGGELFDRVRELKRFHERDCADAAFQMLLALNYLHSKCIVHRDLKLENWLYEKKGGQYLKLIDFGFSKLTRPDVKMHMSCGTISYVAPEVLDMSYTSQCDMWSLGIVVFILLAGYMPFSGSDEVQKRKIRKGNYVMKPAKWDSVSPQATEFTKTLLSVDPTIRLTAAQALQHPFIAGREKLQVTEIDTGIVDALRNFRHATRFRKCCMEMLAWSLSSEERAQIREFFMAMDADQQGTISLGELKHVLVDKFHIADAEVKQVFEALDTNHDEEIHYSDFLAAVASTRINMHEDLLRSAFAKFDADNSGYITLDNLQQILGSTYEGENVANFLQEADLLHDNRISYPEFVAYIKQAPLEVTNGVEKIVDKSVAESPVRSAAVLTPKSAKDLARRKGTPACWSACAAFFN